MGSSIDVLLGDLDVRSSSSGDWSGLNKLKSHSAEHGSKTGGGAVAVDARTPATFEVKKLSKVISNRATISHITAPPMLGSASEELVYSSPTLTGITAASIEGRLPVLLRFGMIQTVKLPNVLQPLLPSGSTMRITKGLSFKKASFTFKSSPLRVEPGSQRLVPTKGDLQRHRLIKNVQQDTVICVK